jgi:uncharacterized protein
MPAVTVRDESISHDGFYVPQFEVRIQGIGLPQDVLRDVTQLTYHDSIKEIDGFELTVNNWDSTIQNFKYIGAETTDSLKKNPLHRLFEPCSKEVEVWMGYLGDLRLMLKGTLTTMEPNFPSGGAPTLNVRGLNVLHALRCKQYNTTWTVTSEKPQGWRDSEIAENIATLRDPKGRKRFPLPIVITKKKEPPLPYVAQENQYDIDFLLARARQLGYVIYVKEGDPKGRGPQRERHLYFGPSDSTHPALPTVTYELPTVTYELKWGISLIDLKPTLSTANQVKSVTVRGWNRATKQAISATATLENLNVNKDLFRLLDNCESFEGCGGREKVVVNKPVHTPAQAQTLALAMLTDRLKEMVKVSGTCVGLPDLRAGQQVRIEGIGSRLSGTYFVTSTTHTINDSGYITKFDARRENLGAEKA